MVVPIPRSRSHHGHPASLSIFSCLCLFSNTTVGYVSNILHQLCKHAGGRYPKKGLFGLLQPFSFKSPVRVALAKGCPRCSGKESWEQADSAVSPAAAALNDLETTHSSHAALVFQGRGRAAAFCFRANRWSPKDFRAGRVLASQRLQKDAKPCSHFLR